MNSYFFYVDYSFVLLCAVFLPLSFCVKIVTQKCFLLIRSANVFRLWMEGSNIYVIEGRHEYLESIHNIILILGIQYLQIYRFTTTGNTQLNSIL